MESNNTAEIAPILTLEEEVKVLKNILADPSDIYSLRLFNLHHGIEEE